MRNEQRQPTRKARGDTAMDGHRLSLPQGNNPGAQAARPRHIWKVGQRAAQAALAFLLLVGGFLSLFPLGRALTRSALLLPALLSDSVPAPWWCPATPCASSASRSPRPFGPVFLGHLRASNATRRRSPAGARPSLTCRAPAITARSGKLMNLSQSLAREGVVVVTVGTPELFNYQVSAQDGKAVVQAFKFIEHWPGVNPQHIGIMAFSVGDLLACMAGRLRPAHPGPGGVPGLPGRLCGCDQPAQHCGQALPGRRWPDATVAAWISTRPLCAVPHREQPVHARGSEALTDCLSAHREPGVPTTARGNTAQLSPDATASYHLLEGDEPGSFDRNFAALSPPLKALLTQALAAVGPRPDPRADPPAA